MNTILENLKLYFQNNSEKQIISDWAESEKYNSIDSKIYELIVKEIFEFNHAIRIREGSI